GGLLLLFRLFFFSVELRFTIALVFFFQAEDGIRDATVTGVQTCALPISPIEPAAVRPEIDGLRVLGAERQRADVEACQPRVLALPGPSPVDALEDPLASRDVQRARP